MNAALIGLGILVAATFLEDEKYKRALQRGFGWLHSTATIDKRQSKIARALDLGTSPSLHQLLTALGHSRTMSRSVGHQRLVVR